MENKSYEPYQSKSRDKGVALFIVMGLLLLLSIGAAVILLLAYNYTYTTRKQVDRIKAFYLAEAGIHHAFYRLRTDLNEPKSYVGSPVERIRPDPDGAEVEITVTGPSGGVYIIKSKAIY